MRQSEKRAGIREDKGEWSDHGHVGLVVSDYQLLSSRLHVWTYDLLHSHVLASNFALTSEVLITSQFT